MWPFDLFLRPVDPSIISKGLNLYQDCLSKGIKMTKCGNKGQKIKKIEACNERSFLKFGLRAKKSGQSCAMALKIV